MMNAVNLKKLAKIYHCMFQSVEKHLRLFPPNVNRKGGKGGQANSDAALRYALRSSLKSSIYRIIVTFNKHLR